MDIPTGYPISSSPWTGNPRKPKTFEQRLAAFDDVIPKGRLRPWRKLKADIAELQMDHDLLVSDQR